MNDGHKVAEEWVKEDLHQNSNIFGDDVCIITNQSLETRAFFWIQGSRFFTPFDWSKQNLKLKYVRTLEDTTNKGAFFQNDRFRKRGHEKLPFAQTNDYSF